MAVASERVASHDSPKHRIGASTFVRIVGYAEMPDGMDLENSPLFTPKL